ncbi:PKD domain-containing protein [Halostella salina]|uniref:PKD domain-containing protein n=1 Tax=Halostella salina TaxID=1547897 RepID=UPI000EF81C62|nr:PKD domain-containing protein [Halostella salina]
MGSDRSTGDDSAGADDGGDLPVARRTVLKSAAGALGVGVGVAGTTGAAAARRDAVLSEGFEDYSVGGYPNGWKKNGNSDQGVVDSPAASGDRALRLTGSSGGCWEAIANAPIDLPESGSATLRLSVYPTTNGEVGCHDNRGDIGLGTSAESWNAGDGWRLVQFGTDDRLVGPGGTDLGPYETGAWQTLEFTYERTERGVRVSFAVDGAERGSAVRPVSEFENDISWLTLSSGEFTIYFDDVTLTTGDGGGPTASFTFSPSDPETNETVQFDASGSEDPDGSIERYEWDFTGDGTFNVTGQTVDHRFTDDVDYDVTLRVTDDAGNRDTVTKTVPVSGSNSAPDAAFTYSPSDPAVGDEVTFDAGPSADPDGTIQSYNWDLNADGTADVQGEVVSETYDSAGEYTVTLAVEDDAGSHDTVQRTVSVGEGNASPTADFTVSPDAPAVGEQVTLDASAASDPDGSIASYEWDVDGDGSVETQGQAVGVAYDESGTYTVTLEVRDDDGATDTARRTIGVETSNTPPSAAFEYTPGDPAVGETVTLDASGSSDPDGSVVSYEWDVDGDGSYERSGRTVDYAFESAGDHPVTLRVTDDAGATDEVTDTVPVVELEGPEPSFTISNPEPMLGEAVTLDASGSSDPDGTVRAYEWDVDGDGEYEKRGVEVTHRFESTDATQVSLRVTDGDGLQGTSRQNVAVAQTFRSRRSRKFDLADSIDDDSVLATLEPLADVPGDRELAEYTFGELETAAGTGEIDPGTANEAARRLLIGERATHGIVETIGPGNDTTGLRFARRIAESVCSVGIKLLLFKVAIGEKLASLASGLVASTLLYTAGETIADGIDYLFTNMLPADDGRTEARTEAKSKARGLWDDIAAGAAATAELIAEAIETLADVVEGIVRATVEFSRVAPLSMTTSPESLGELAFGNSIWREQIRLHSDLQPDSVAGGLPGSTETVAQAREDGVTTVRTNFENIASDLDTLKNDLGDFNVVDSVADIGEADSWADYGLQALQALASLLSSIFSLLVESFAIGATGTAILMARKIHAEVIDSVLAGEHRVDGWAPV